ncbi:MAG: glycoside hydrolase family 5 protein [Bacteroidales bacterium]|nr:glycoside hydrolase family 5 protein [Bacteroidales bacterium]
MKTSKVYGFLFIALAINWLFLSGFSQQTPSVVEKNGFLRVKGNKLVNQHGEVVQLRGMSLCWTQWFPKHYNYETVKWLRDDWKCEVVRAAMAVEWDGYLAHPDLEQQKVETVVHAAIDLGIYVIIDWHDHHANRNIEAAKKFFGEMARKFNLFPNIIYETFNEPEKIGWSDSIKPYHEAIIAEIRKYDKRNLIICGTPTWSQDVDIAASDPIKAYNIAYTLHYYAATHKQWLRDKLVKALNMGIPVFVTEYGLCEASGDGPIDFEESVKWWDLLDEYKISYCNWAIYDKKESAAALKPVANALGGWKIEDLTPSGRLVRAKLRGEKLEKP